MTRVDFYIVETPGERALLHFACRLTEKAYRLSHRVHLHAAGRDQAATLDDLLWTFRDGSFVPHEIVAAGIEPAAPVTISHGDVLPADCEILLNLTGEVPGFVERFSRVAELVDGDPASRRLSRERFQFYRDKGYPLETHAIG